MAAPFSSSFPARSIAGAAGAASYSTPESEWDKFKQVYREAIRDAQKFIAELNERTLSPDYKELARRISSIIDGQNHALRRSKILPYEQKYRADSYLSIFEPLIKTAKLKVPCYLLSAGFASLNEAANPLAFQANLSECLEKLKNSLPLLSSRVEPNFLDLEIVPSFEKVMQILEENTKELLVEGVTVKQFILTSSAGAAGAAASSSRSIDRISAQIERALVHVSEASFVDSVRVKFAKKAFVGALVTLQKLQSTNDPSTFQSTLCRAFAEMLEALPSLSKDDEPRVMHPHFAVVLNFVMANIEEYTKRLIVEGVSFKEFLIPETAAGSAAPPPVSLDELAAKIRRIIASVSGVGFVASIKAKLLEDLSASIEEKIALIRTVPIEELQTIAPELLGLLRDLANLKADKDNPRVIDPAHSATFKSYLKDFLTQLDFVLIGDRTVAEFILRPSEVVSSLAEVASGTGAGTTSIVASGEAPPIEDMITANLALLRNAADLIESYAHLISSTLPPSIRTPSSRDDLSSVGGFGYVSCGEGSE